MSGSGQYSSEDGLAAGWISRMALGESEALTALYRLYHRPLLTVFYGILGDRQAAEEVLQDTFVKAFHKASSFDPNKGSAFAWLVTIGKRLSIDRLRRKKSRPVLGNWEQSESSRDNIPEREEQDARRRMEYSWIHETLGNLPERQRTVIELAFLDGYTHHEIAKLTGIPLGTIKSDLYRGLNALREKHFGNDD